MYLKPTIIMSQRDLRPIYFGIFLNLLLLQTCHFFFFFFFLISNIGTRNDEIRAVFVIISENRR